MRGIVGVLALVAALAMSVAGAQATIVYSKGSKIYSATDAGKNSKLVASGDGFQIMGDDQTVVYTNSTDVMFKVPITGGPPIAFGGAVRWCSKCSLGGSPDGRSVLVTAENGDVDYVPLDGGPAVRIANNIYTAPSYSPNSQYVAFDQDSTDTTSVFTTPVTGATPTKLNIGFATTPIWTDAGIVASTIGLTGNKIQYKLVLLDPLGNVKRVLQRKTVNEKSYKNGYGLQDANWPAGSNVITLAFGKRSTTTLRLVSTSSGKVKSKLTFNKSEGVWAANFSGTKILVIGKKGKLQSVDMRNGKRKTLVKSGVDAADISR